MEKYYEAYDKRYKQVHDKGLAWESDSNSKIVEDIINKYNLQNASMLEIGCGEGRDARYLLDKGYKLLATDISLEAIKYCIDNDINHRENYKVLDALKDSTDNTEYLFIYSVVCLHMLVLDEDRNKFYKYIYEHLSKDGYSLILTMGDGKRESASDITKAFDDVERVHQETDEKINVAATSCRIVNFDTLFKEVKDNNFDILEHGVTEIENHFNEIMYVLLKKH